MYTNEENSKKGLGINIMYDGEMHGLSNKIPFLTCGLVISPNNKVAKGNALFMLVGKTKQRLKRCVLTYLLLIIKME